MRLVRCLGFHLPVIDPSIYISRFASLLDFGDETQRVATDATRLVQRFNKDWITHGRRPAGICGACLLLAARMNNFRRSVAEIVQVVKIADVTLRKRLDEFKNTSSSKLTIDDFRNIWLEEENEPPAFYIARLPKKGRVIKGEDVKVTVKDGDEASDGHDADDEDIAAEEAIVDPRLDALTDQATEAEISQYLDDPAAKEEFLTNSGVFKRSGTEVPEETNELTGLDEEELDAFILDENEVKIKERVWIEFNRDYLEKTLERQLKMEADIKAGITPKASRRKRKQHRDSSAAPATAAEATKQMMKKRNFSKKLNYNVIESLFDDDAKPQDSRKSRSAEEEDDIEQSYFDSDAESVIEEDGTELPANHPMVRKRSRLDEKQRARRQRSAHSTAVITEDESGTDRATSRALTDGETDAESDFRSDHYPDEEDVHAYG